MAEGLSVEGLIKVVHLSGRPYVTEAERVRDSFRINAALSPFHRVVPAFLNVHAILQNQFFSEKEDST